MNGWILNTAKSSEVCCLYWHKSVLNVHGPSSENGCKNCRGLPTEQGEAFFGGWGITGPEDPLSLKRCKMWHLQGDWEAEEVLLKLFKTIIDCIIYSLYNRAGRTFLSTDLTCGFMTKYTKVIEHGRKLRERIEHDRDFECRSNNWLCLLDWLNITTLLVPEQAEKKNKYIYSFTLCTLVQQLSHTGTPGNRHASLRLLISVSAAWDVKTVLVDQVAESI